MPIVGFQVTEAQKAELEALVGHNLSGYLRRIVFARLEHALSVDLVFRRLDRLETLIASDALTRFSHG